MIKNIIFDFGDVFINLDKAATLRELNKLGMKEPKPELLQLFFAYEKGIINTSQFLEEVGPIFPGASKERLTAAWNAILLDLPEYRLQFLESLAELNAYQLFLLSNTNSLHMSYVQATMGDRRFERFMNCFVEVYLSHQMKMRKPETEIFQHVLEQQGLSPRETLFIDDTLENIESAARLGLSVWHLNPEKDDIVDLSKKLPNG